MWRLVAFDLLTRALNVQDKRVVRRGDVEDGVIAVTGAAAIEAEEANIETCRVILSAQSVEEGHQIQRSSR